MCVIFKAWGLARVPPTLSNSWRRLSPRPSSRATVDSDTYTNTNIDKQSKLDNRAYCLTTNRAL